MDFFEAEGEDCSERKLLEHKKLCEIVFNLLGPLECQNSRHSTVKEKNPIDN